MRNPVRSAVLLAIRAYQKTLSPDHGPLRHLSPGAGCRYYPTCSNYTHEAVEKYGAILGLWLGAKRLIRCHPWAHGGHDPVPEIRAKDQGKSTKH